MFGARSRQSGKTLNLTPWITSYKRWVLLIFIEDRKSVV